MRMHSTRIGAAFGASIIFSLFAGSAAAEKAASPVFACFDASRAAQVGVLGAGSKEVQAAFEYGACLALPAGTELASSSREGGVRRISLDSNTPPLYAADAVQSASFARYLPVTAALLDQGRALMRCSTDSAALELDIADFSQRWHDYWLKHMPPLSADGMKHIIHVGDEGPKLYAEKEEMDARWNELNNRCGGDRAMSVDASFAAFLRSERMDT